MRIYFAKLTSLFLCTCCILSSCATPAPPVVSPSPTPYTPPDFSDHTAPNEAEYRTVLFDPARLGEGERVLALEESPLNYPVSRYDRKQKQDPAWGFDMRHCIVSARDFSRISDLNDISFSSTTRWPEQLPDGFDPEYILEFNKNPGLGIRALHEQGITGEGVSIAILDQALLPGHQEYADSLMSYERIHCRPPYAEMHGSAVASIAVGNDVGVAPDAKLYYIAESHSHGDVLDASVLADCVLRVLEYNRHLPEGGKIRVISISRGYNEKDIGYREMTDAIRQADEAGVLVMTTSTAQYYDFTLFGMDRDYLADPDDMDSYEPASWIADRAASQPQFFSDFTLVPMGSRTYAAPTGNGDYEIGHNGGLSWAVPWCAGFYALCCQVKPEITPSEFIETVKATSVPVGFGNIVDPAAAIKSLQN